MPTYVFECQNKKCHAVYEELIPLSEFDSTGKWPGVQCPACKSKKKILMPSMPADIIFRNVEGTSKMDNWYYRQGHFLEKAQNERRSAQEKSHMGTNPYPHLDDISSGEYFGEVQ